MEVPEPVWLDAFALEVVARACSDELGAAVRLPSAHCRRTRRRAERERDPGWLSGRSMVRVPARDAVVVDRLLAAPRSAWHAGERSPIELALRLRDALAGAAAIRGDRALLATLSVLYFLHVNGWLTTELDGRSFVLQARRLAGGTGAAAAQALQMLVRSAV